jgi:hypothetical protein
MSLTMTSVSAETPNLSSVVRLSCGHFVRDTAWHGLYSPVPVHHGFLWYDFGSVGR